MVWISEDGEADERSSQEVWSRAKSQQDRTPGCSGSGSGQMAQSQASVAVIASICGLVGTDLHCQPPHTELSKR